MEELTAIHNFYNMNAGDCNEQSVIDASFTNSLTNLNLYASTLYTHTA